MWHKKKYHHLQFATSTYYRGISRFKNNSRDSLQGISHTTHAAYELSINPQKFYDACICLQLFQTQSMRTFNLYLTSCRKLNLDMSKLSYLIRA